MRLDELVARRGDEIAVSWRSFLLRTEPKFPSREGFAAYTESWLRPAAMEPAVSFRTWDEASDEPPSSSLPAQISAKAVDRVSPEATSVHHHALMEAYFTANRDISNWEVLAGVASDCGVDMAAYGELLGSERQHLASLVIDDHNAAVEREIHAVPSVLVADRLVVPGAQDVEVYERIIDRMKPTSQTA